MEDKSGRGGAGGVKRRCRYGAECRNKHSCKFYHPPSTEIGQDGRKSNPKNLEKKNAPPKRDRSKIQCRYGMECRNTKCPFFHHPAAAPLSSPTQPQPTKVSPPNNDMANGKYPPKASQSNFAEKEKTRQSPESPHLPSPHTPSRKAGTKKKCRWGAGCRNKKCTFVHPGQQVDRYPAPSNGHCTVIENSKVKTPESKTNASPNRAVAARNGAKENHATRPATHPILPPSPLTHDPIETESVEPRPYTPGLFFPSTPSMPSQQTQTSKAVSRFNGLFSSVPSTPSSRISGEEPRERFPLYSNNRNPNPSNAEADRAAENQKEFYQPVGSTANGDQNKAHSEDQPPDADWLFEVLGLNDLDVSDNIAIQQRQSVIEHVSEEPFIKDIGNGGDHVNSSSVRENSSSEHTDQVPPQIDRSHSGVKSPNEDAQEKPSKKLISEDEIVLSRRAALELRLESQQNSNNSELLFTLLQTCRSKQEMIKTALERSMESSGDGISAEFDETNIMSLLELNELLVGAIDIAESSLTVTKSPDNKSSGNGEEGISKTGTNKSPNRMKGQQKKEESLWKPVNKKTSSPAAKTKKPKPAGNQSKAKKSTNKLLPSKPATPKVEDCKQEERPKDVLPQSEPSVDKAASNLAPTVDTAQQEKERMARMLEEARKQSAAARERKKSKKSKKFDKWVKQNEEARENRAKSWSERIAKENDYIDLIHKLLVAEFLRQSKSKAMGLTSERVLSDPNASETIAKECREAYHTIFRGLKCRVVVAGSENKDMNGRQGTIRFWDREKEKFCVGLDTKKSQDSDVQFLIPDNLEELTSSRPPKSEKKSSSPSYGVDVPHLVVYGGVFLGFSFTLLKSHVVALGSAESTKIGLKEFCKQRDAEEQKQKLEEEAERLREEEDGKRRAARRAQENAAWEKRKEQMRRDKEEYEKMKKEWAKERHEYGQSTFYGDDDEDDEECTCPRCRFGGRFGNKFSSSGGAFFFNIGGIPFRVRFDSYDSDEESFFDEFDERWEDQLAEEKEEENRKQADVLGVQHDADARTIKLAYRKLALQYHPDKWKSDSEHGMTRKEAENRFKSIQSAYDHLLANFDD
ncbi:hypothetical protein ACHAWF_008734 [Thalassiosira exigua]